VEVSRFVYPILKISILLGLIGFVVAFIYGVFIALSSIDANETAKYMQNLKFIMLCSVALVHVPILLFVVYIVFNAFLKK